ncbi:MAG: hypothetical protein RL538_726 [Candidatus Parcubacteria bacterium]|jgi:hypothetical protein
MTKQLFNGLLVLAALLVSFPSFANSVPTVPPAESLAVVSVPVVQPLPVDESAPEFWLTGRVSLVGGEVSSSQQQHRYALLENLPFMTSEAEYQSSIASGRLVRLEGPYLEMHARRPYVLPSTAAFVLELSRGYFEFGCGRLVVKDAARLVSEQPSNGSTFSVHPAGMAVDVRTKYIRPECADWLRAYISEKEAEGKVDGTQEWRPEHLHVVVPLQPRGPSRLLATTTTSVGAP